METKERRNCFRCFALFSLMGSIWKHLEADCFRCLAAFGSIWELTIFAIWKRLEADCFSYLEAFGSWLLSLFGTVFAFKKHFGSIWKHLEAVFFRYFGPFSHWKDELAKTVKLPNASKTGHILYCCARTQHQIIIHLGPQRRTKPYRRMVFRQRWGWVGHRSYEWPLNPTGFTGFSRD
jgi:hypothetical protein